MRSALSGLLIVSALACADAQTAPQTPTGSQAAASPLGAATSPNQDAVVAEVAGRKITLKELDDHWQKTDPGERARVTQMVYQNQRNMLDLMIGDALIEQAAKAAGLPQDKFVEQETAKLLQPVTDADVQQFFESNKDRTQGRSV